MNKFDDTVVAIDLGSSEVRVVVADVADGEIEILGAGTAPSEGVREGRIVNVSQLMVAVDGALEVAESMAGTMTRSVHLCCSGGFRRSINRLGMAPVDGRTVKPSHVAIARRTATALKLGADEGILAAVNQGYAVDDTEGVVDPIGMAAACLYSRYHVVVVSKKNEKLMRGVAEHLRLQVAGIHESALASAEAVLDADEKELGAACLDIGQGITALSVYRAGTLCHTATIPVGAGRMVEDLAQGLRLPVGLAADLARRHGLVEPTLLRREENVELPAAAGRDRRPLSRAVLAELMQPSFMDVMDAVATELVAVGLPAKDLAGGVVLTGGGASIAGTAELATRVLGVNVRRGIPLGFGGVNNVVSGLGFSAALGAVRRAASTQKRYEPVSWWKRRWQEFGEMYF